MQKWGRRCEIDIMKRRIPAAALAVAALIAAPAMAKDKLYDDFHGRKIDSQKWNGAGGDFWMFETTREIDRTGGTRRLHLGMTAYSPQVDDGNGTGAVFGLYFSHPQGITGATYDVDVESAEARICPSNPDAEVVTGPEFRARFFNTQANPTSQVGDVEVAVGFDRRPTDVNCALTAAYLYEECNNADCSARTTLDQGTFGTVQPGTTNNIGVHWEGKRHRFVFELNGTTRVSKYTVSDTSPPNAPDKEIDVAREIANCAGTPRPYTSVDAYFSKVTISH